MKTQAKSLGLEMCDDDTLEIHSKGQIKRNNSWNGEQWMLMSV